MQSKEFKVSLIGHTGTGKTAFLEKLLYEQARIITPSIRNTIGVDVTPFNYKFENGNYRIIFWDCAGDNRFIGLGKDYLINSDLIILFSKGNIKDDQQFLSWLPSNIPYIIVNNNSTSTILNMIKNNLHY